MFRSGRTTLIKNKENRLYTTKIAANYLITEIDEQGELCLFHV